MRRADVGRYERELHTNPAIAEQILRTFPLVVEPERITVRADRESLDPAICKALALAVMGFDSKVEMINE